MNDINSSIAHFKVKGLTAAVFTPLKEDGNLNLGVIDAYADQLLSDGVRNIFPCGTTGEGPCLTVEERKQVAEKWIQAGKNKFDVIMVHVGTESIKSTQQLAAHASEIGADAICSVAPVYFKPQSVELLLQYLCEVSKSAPTLPLYYYHNPAHTGITFSLEAIWTGLKKTPVPTLRGVKFTNSNFYDMSRVMLLAGTDYKFSTPLTSNYRQPWPWELKDLSAGRGANRILEAHKAGDFKTLNKEYEMYLSFISVLFKYGGNVGVNKCLMKVAKCQDIGPARLPNPNLNSETLHLMVQDLKKIGFLDWIK